VTPTKTEAAESPACDAGTVYRLIDLFSGAGGMTLGFTREFGNPFVPVWANDYDAAAAATYNENFGGHCVVGDIVSLLRDSEIEIPKADVVIGGPPCQGFSLLNKEREGDPRKHLWRPFMDVVEMSGADVFVIENVPQILGSSEHEGILRAAERLDFEVVSAKLCAADYGVPQVRWRAFIVGSRLGGESIEKSFPPPKTHRQPGVEGGPREAGLPPWRTVRDAAGDLPAPAGKAMRDAPSPLDLHFGRTPTETSLARYRAIPREGMNRFDLERAAPELTPGCWLRKRTGGTDLFGRLWWDRPAFTIRTEFYKPEKGRYLHPVQDRPITHREAARFQSFPDSFSFRGSRAEVARQIGNAVPPLLAAAVSRGVREILAQRTGTRARRAA
jgi:DNA (cytosine-5)-methyltransferase 1